MNLVKRAMSAVRALIAMTTIMTMIEAESQPKRQVGVGVGREIGDIGGRQITLMKGDAHD